MGSGLLVMAEVLFMAHDKVKADPEEHAKAYKRGDVICIHADGWGWTLRERTNPDWRILRLTRITDLTDLEGLLRAELGAGDVTRRRRNAFIDPAKLPAAVQAWLNDDTRVIQIFESTVNRNTVLSYITAKAPRAQAFKVFG